MRIGLLGGSFNPAHDGHRHVAELARRRLRLDQVWLMVSPGNPLKSSRGMASLSSRLASARGVADGRRIVATAIEAAWGTRYTVDTLTELRRRFPRVRFVWLMGADILKQLPRWLHWRRIAASVSFAVLPRPGYTRPALAGEAAHALAHARMPARTAPLLALSRRPAWCFLPAAQHGASATAIRDARRAARRASLALSAAHKDLRHRPHTSDRPARTARAETAAPPRLRLGAHDNASGSGHAGGQGAGPAHAGDAPQESRRRRAEPGLAG